MTTVAVLGTGIMGAPIARNLARAGLHVRAWNRTLAKAEPLADDGVRICRTPAEALDGADVLLTMLADADAVESSLRGDDALAHAAQRGELVWMQSSTVGVPDTERLMKYAADVGVGYIDAPVLGTKGPAEAGELTVLASGPEHLRERCQPVFDAIGSRTFWLGDAGRGTRLKLVMNSWVLALVTSTAEAMALADGLGLDPKRFLDTIAGGPLDNAYAHLKGNAMIRREFPPAFPVWGGAKDAGLILEAGEIAGVNLAVTEAVQRQLQATADAGHEDEDVAAVWCIVRGERT
jgi:3-hydroxyisobutyrate dehydrogenase